MTFVATAREEISKSDLYNQLCDLMIARHASILLPILLFDRMRQGLYWTWQNLPLLRGILPKAAPFICGFSTMARQNIRISLFPRDRPIVSHILWPRQGMSEMLL